MGVIENYSKFEILRIRFLEARVSESEINQRLLSVYGQNVFSKKEVAVSCNKFEVGQMALNNDPEKHRLTKDLAY
jgi:hypothetical protein